MFLIGLRQKTQCGKNSGNYYKKKEPVAACSCSGSMNSRHCLTNSNVTILMLWSNHCSAIAATIGLPDINEILPNTNHPLNPICSTRRLQINLPSETFPLWMCLSCYMSKNIVGSNSKCEVFIYVVTNWKSVTVLGVNTWSSVSFSPVKSLTGKMPDQMDWWLGQGKWPFQNRQAAITHPLSCGYSWRWNYLWNPGWLLLCGFGLYDKNNFQAGRS